LSLVLQRAREFAKKRFEQDFALCCSSLTAQLVIGFYIYALPQATNSMAKLLKLSNVDFERNQKGFDGSSGISHSHCTFTPRDFSHDSGRRFG
jgi:hypothetical protein